MLGLTVPPKSRKAARPYCAARPACGDRRGDRVTERNSAPIVNGSFAEGRNIMEDRFLKRLRKKARKGLRGWPMATVAFYGPNLSQATKVTVGIVPSENAEVKELRDWKVDRGDIRADPGIAQEILEFIEQHRVLSVAMTDSIIGCPHQEGIDYEGEWCPACEFWHGRDRFTGQTVN
jgi:hypothetical protein